MRILITYMVLLLLLLSCKQSDKLTFEPLYLNENNCDQCPVVLVNIPRAVEKDRLSNAINNALKDEIIAQLTFDEEIENLNIQEAITSFTEEYVGLQEMHPEELALWEAKIKAEVTFEDPRMITLKLESFLFTGGAHGYVSTRFLNFNKIKGVQIEDWELFNDSRDFQRFAENKFRKQENIPPNKPINSTGYMFERDRFYLPENIGFTEEGIKLLYNQYEVASFADGPVEITLPYKEVKKYLSGEIKS